MNNGLHIVIIARIDTMSYDVKLERDGDRSTQRTLWRNPWRQTGERESVVGGFALGKRGLLGQVEVLCGGGSVLSIINDCYLFFFLLSQFIVRLVCISILLSFPPSLFHPRSLPCAISLPYFLSPLPLLLHRGGSNACWWSWLINYRNR